MLLLSQKRGENMNIMKIFRLFPTQEKCIEYLENKRWGNKVYCPYCKSINIHKSRERNRHFCNNCQTSFSVTVNTIMHDSRLPLQKWFLAICLIANAKKGISSRQLARDLELPVKTAYSLSQRIRKAMLGEKSPLLKGIIEIDETYIGGKPRYRNGGGNKRGRGTKKQMVVGAVERNGSVVAMPYDTFKQKDARNLILENIDIANSHVYTDEYKVYNRVNLLAKRSQVNHGAKQYVNGNIHTNSIEGFWAIVKRQRYGQHHHYSKKYTDKYIAEAVFKYNHRNDDEENIFNKIIERTLNV